MSTHSRQPAGSPVGGQFAPSSRTEPDLTLEQLAEAEGLEDAMFDPDDPYRAWLAEHEAHHGEVPAVPEDLSTLDRYQLQALRRQVLARIDRARTELDGCAGDRAWASSAGDLEQVAQAVSDEARADAELTAATEDLHRISEALHAGSVSRDDMSAQQREQVDATFRHAYAYGLERVGGIALQDRDEAEEFASFVARQLVQFDFDDSALEMSRSLKAFEAERAGVLAAQVARSAEEQAWAKRMATDGGLRVADLGGRRGRRVADLGGRRGRRAHEAALSRFVSRLAGGGFFVETRVGDDGLVYRLTGGRPAPGPVTDAAA